MTAAKYLDRIRIKPKDRRLAEMALCFRAGFFAREKTSDYQLAWKLYKQRFVDGEKIHTKDSEDSTAKKNKECIE